MLDGYIPFLFLYRYLRGDYNCAEFCENSENVCFKFFLQTNNPTGFYYSIVYYMNNSSI